jgi:hypothetical protein
MLCSLGDEAAGVGLAHRVASHVVARTRVDVDDRTDRAPAGLTASPSLRPVRAAFVTTPVTTMEARGRPGTSPARRTIGHCRGPPSCHPVDLAQPDRAVQRGQPCAEPPPVLDQLCPRCTVW